MSWNVDCLHTHWDPPVKTSQTSSSWAERVGIRWPTIITRHQGLLFRVPTWVWLGVLEEPRGECFLPKFLGCEMYHITSSPQAWLCCQKHTWPNPHTPGAYPVSATTGSRAIPGELRNTHLEDTRSCAEKEAERKAAGQSGNQPMGALWIEDWGALGIFISQDASVLHGA